MSEPFGVELQRLREDEERKVWQYFWEEVYAAIKGAFQDDVRQGSTTVCVDYSIHQAHPDEIRPQHLSDSEVLELCEGAIFGVWMDLIRRDEGRAGKRSWLRLLRMRVLRHEGYGAVIARWTVDDRDARTILREKDE